MLCDANGAPLRFLLSDGQASDIDYAQPVLEGALYPQLARSPTQALSMAGCWLLAAGC
jgi:transposase